MVGGQFAEVTAASWGRDDETSIIQGDQGMKSQEQAGKEPFWPENGRTMGGDEEVKDAWAGSLRTCGDGSVTRTWEIRRAVLKGV